MFGKRLNEIRHMRGHTAQQMADYLNVDLRAYRYYESGQRQPGHAMLVKIADYLDVSLDYLFGRDEFIKKHTPGSEQHPE